jgi:hypothetical protein
MSKIFKTPIKPPVLSADPAGTAGDIYFNSASKVLRFHTGVSWTDVGTGSGGGSSTTSIQVLSSAPSYPTEGMVYFDSNERTVKAYNGTIWYDVAGPKEILDHTHYNDPDGPVKYVDYGTYVMDSIVSINGGQAFTTEFSDIINGGNA